VLEIVGEEIKVGVSNTYFKGALKIAKV